MKKLTTAFLFLVMLTQGAAFAAANFSFGPLPGTSIPSGIPAGGSATIYIVVTNNSRIYLKDYVVSGVPATVTQITSSTITSPYTICSNPINLRAIESCLLILKISEPVNTKFALCNKFACTTSGIPLFFPAVANVPGIAAGLYVNHEGGIYPLIVHSAGGTNPWSYVVDSDPTTLPSDYLSDFGSGFVTAACSGQICLAGGDYHSSTAVYIGQQAPLLGLSTDGGATWSYPPTIISGLPAGSFYEFFSVAINGSLAAAVGEASFTNLFAISNDSGSSWTYTTVEPFDFDASSGSGYLGSACNSSLCLGAGFYGNGSGDFLVVTIPSASQTPIDSSVTPTGLDPSGNNAFNAASCSDIVCAAVGTYTGAGSVNYPTVAEGTGNFLTWSFVIDSMNTFPMNFSNFGAFTGVSCSGASCVAVGSYEDAFSNTFPLLAVRSGGTWSLTNILNSFPVGSTDASLQAVSCSGNLCVAIGATTITTANIPIALVSHDAGLTWTVPPSILNFPQDSGGGSGIFNTVTCSGQNCIIAGNYFSAFLDGIIFPWVVESTDGGVTWTYAVSASTPTLPSDYFTDGDLNGSGITGALKVQVPNRL